MTRSIGFQRIRLSHRHLLALSVGIAVACFVTIATNRTRAVVDIPSIVLPLGFATILGLLSLKLHWHDYDSEIVDTIVKYSWGGGLIASAVGGWWVVLHFYLAMPTVGLPEQILTLVSGGVGAGVVAGYFRTESFSAVATDATDDVLIQTTWTQRSDDSPVLRAIVESMAELERREAVDLDPLYTHIDPEVFPLLLAHEGSPWQLSFYTDRYVIEVSSVGTVTCYEAETPSERSRTVVSF